jgi:ribosomal protein L3
MLRQGLIVVKQEMTRLRVDGKYQAVTLVKMPIQEVVRMKTQDRDGYEAALLGANKKESDKEKGQKISYGYQFEVRTAV